MKKRTLIWSGVLLTALFLISTVLTGCAASMESAAPVPMAAVSPVTASSMTAAATDASPGAPQEGIKVHGHWTINVLNPDSTLVTHREFENALLKGHDLGDDALIILLMRGGSVGMWSVSIWNDIGSDNPWGLQGSTSYPNNALITENAYPYASTSIFKNLTVDVPTSGANQNKLVLSGQATALNNGSIDYVQTIFDMLSQGSPPGNSTYTGDIYFITKTMLSPAVTVGAGQLIIVTVVISFS